MSSKFTFQITEDGSPTLEIMRPDGQKEKMHHYMGALSETIHVYGRALEISLSRKWPAHFFSLGLGLGYNEILAVTLSIKYGQSPRIWSFELDESLRKFFCGWILGQEVDSHFSKTYDQIISQICQYCSVSESLVRLELKRLLSENQLRLLEGFHPGYNLEEQQFSVVMYDAFSDKISPELWELEALEYVLKKGTNRTAVFATYASKGRLKRALKEHDFELLDILGYGNKRECTIAIREN